MSFIFALQMIHHRAPGARSQVAARPEEPSSHLLEAKSTRVAALVRIDGVSTGQQHYGAWR